MATVTSTGFNPQRTAFSIIAAASFCHMLNDIMQSLLTSLYPLLKANYALDFVQIGLLTFAFQVTASLLQPVVGMVTDRWPMPFPCPWPCSPPAPASSRSPLPIVSRFW